MSSITKSEPQMEASSLVRLFGLACLTGGLLWLGLNLANAFGLPQGPPVVSVLVSVVMLLSLSGGPLGLLALRATGSGRTGRIGLTGAAIALLGLLSYLAGVLYGLAAPESGLVPASYAGGALLVGLGMLVLGIAVLAARSLTGWRRVVPLLVGLYYPAMIPVQIILFIGPNGRPSMAFLAFWGLTWALLGYAILSEAQTRRATRLAEIGG